VQAIKEKLFNLLHSNALAWCRQMHACTYVHTNTHIREIRTAFSVKRLNILSKYPKENPVVKVYFSH